MSIEEKARTIFTRAIVALNRTEPFYAYVAKSQLKVAEDTSCKTGWTDGVTLAYNPEWLAERTVDEARSFIAHEVEHVRKGDPWRMLRVAQELHDFWNKGADHSINTRLKRCRFLIPESWLCEARFDGMSTEAIVKIIAEENQNQDEQKGDDSSDDAQNASDGDDSDASESSQDAPGDGSGQSEQSDGASEPSGTSGLGSGECRPAPIEASDLDPDAQNREIDADLNKLRQNVASARKWAESRGGFGSEGLKRDVEEMIAPDTPYEELLREYMTKSVREDSNWLRPQRDYLEEDIYMPTLDSPAEPEVIFAVDTSMSMNAPAFGVASRDVSRIADEMNAKMTVIYCDASVRRVDEFEPGEDVKFDPVGGGGTAFKPVFDYVADKIEDPQVIVYFTDACGSWPETAPDTPTIVVLWGNARDSVPEWAELVSIEGWY